MKKLALLTATGIASFLLLGLATSETTTHPAAPLHSNATRPTPQKTLETDCWDDISCARTTRERVAHKAMSTTPENTPNYYEDDPRWNCFTNGNNSCGAAKHVTSELADALSEGESAAPTYADLRDWESCVILEGDTSFINCPDGYTESS